MTTTSILTGLLQKVNLVGLVEIKPASKENMYIILGLLAFTTLLLITLFIERRLDAKKREKRRHLFVDEDPDDQRPDEMSGGSKTLNMQSLDNVI